MKGIKFNPNTVMRVARVEREIQMPDGRIKRLIRDRVENKEICLGSMKQPQNTDIVKIEWNTPKPTQKGSSIFDNLFDNF